MTATAAQTSILEYESPAPTPRREIGHLLGLDGLRAVAIGLVLAEHLIPLHRPIQAWFPSLRALKPSQITPPLGFVGVSLFFVLSGFLITRILLACRERVRDGQGTVFREAGVFYLRRTLRIFPLYYGVLFALALLNVRQIRDRLPWHLTYTGNWLFCIPEHYSRGGFDRHLWSLCVEEQFYLIWPWLILLAPRRLLLPGLLLTFAAGPMWRAWFGLRGWPWQFTLFPTPACFDLLAAGALLAYLWNTPLRRPTVWACLILGLPSAALVIGLYRSDWMLTGRVIFQQTALALCFTAFVGFTAGGVPIIGRLLECRPMAYVGKISYGIYVFHNFTPPLVRWTLGIDHDADRPWLFAAACLALTFAMAAMSWHLFEAPINRLKERVGYVRRAE